MKNKMIRGIIFATVMVMLTGCSKAKLTENDDPVEILEEAAELLEKEEVRGSETERVYYYDDGTEETEIITSTIDTKKGVHQETTDYDMGFSFSTFNSKEDDGYYVYIQEDEEAMQWIRYKEEAEEGESAYEEAEKGVDFSFDEEYGYQNVAYSNEGIEELDDVEAVKIKITADVISEDSETEEDQEVTRESVLEENGWTEDEVALVDGFSEIIDAYVAECNEESGSSTITYEQNIWVDVATHQILQIESSTMLGEDDSSSGQAFEEFNNAYWQMEMIHGDLEAGMTEEEAVEELKEEIAAMEDSEDEWEDYPNQTKEVTTERFLYGDDCPDLEDLPEDYEEVTEDEYYEGMY